MADDIVVSKENLENAVTALSESLTGGAFGDVKAVAFVHGPDDENPYRKVFAVFHRLFGLGDQLANVLVLLTEDEFCILANSAKVALFSDMGDTVASKRLTVLARTKEDKDKANIQTFIDKIKRTSVPDKVGTLSKDVGGPLGDAWKAACASNGISEVDLVPTVSTMLAEKSEIESDLVKKAASGTVALFTKLQDEILNILDHNQKISHVKLSEKFDDLIPSVCSKATGLRGEDFESCFTPIIQSGKYDLKPSASSSSSNLLVPPDSRVWSIIVCSVGVRYKYFCSNLTRTLICNPTPEQGKCYKIMSAALDEGIKLMTPGTKLLTVYKKVLEFVQGTDANVAKRLTKSFGWGMGYEFRETQYLINDKNEKEIKVGMVFCVSVGVADVPEGSKTYSMQVADTICITESGAQSLTSGITRAYKKISWTIGNEEPAVKPEERLQELFRDRELRKKEDSRLERERQNIEEGQEAIRRKQAALRAAGEKANVVMTDFKPENIVGYKSVSDFPVDVQSRRLKVDFENDCVLVPVNGVPVPFHISMIKNVTKNEGGVNGTILRINFVTPGAGATSALFNQATLQKCFLKELCYRALDAGQLSTVLRNINELKKRYNSRVSDAKDRASIVPQEDLILSKSNIPKLSNLKSFPSVVPRQRKIVGDLEAHTNGFRFSVRKQGINAKIDILYANIRYAFFQPATKHSVQICLHFSLLTPIMILKNKTQEITFWVEYMDEVENTDGARRSKHGDVDEIEEEHRINSIKRRIEEDFANFCKKADVMMAPKRAGRTGFEMTYDDFSIFGTPANEMVELQSTDSCLINVTKRPVFVLDYDDVEIVYFERISLQSGLTSKNFDIAFILKSCWDPTVPAAKAFCRVTAIDIEKLDFISKWFTDKEIRFFSGGTPVLWSDVIKANRQAGKEQFFEDGGWETLEQDDMEDDEEEEEESEFTSGSDSSEEDSDEYESGSVEEESSDGSFTSGDDEEDPAMDAEEMEKWARREDKERGEFDKRPMKKRNADYSDAESSGDDHPKKKSRDASGSSKAGLGAKSAGGSSGKPGGMSSGSTHMSSSKHGSSSSKPSGSAMGGKTSSSSFKPSSSSSKPSTSSSFSKPGMSKPGTSSSFKPPASSSSKPSSSSSSKQFKR